MVLRGQPVGEQGAADRWTALDPYQAGSGAGAPRGHPRGAPPFFSSRMRPQAPRGLDPGAWLLNFLHIVQTRALRGPFSMPRFIFLMPVLSIYWDFSIRGNAGLL